MCTINKSAHTNKSLETYCVLLVYVYFGSISSLIQISFNILDIFCLHIFLLILSYCRSDFIIIGGN